MALGRVRARPPADRPATRRADETATILTVATRFSFRPFLKSAATTHSATRNAAEALLALTEERASRLSWTWVQVYADWARGRLLDPSPARASLRRRWLTQCAGPQARHALFYGLLAELEVDAGPGSALSLDRRGIDDRGGDGRTITDPSSIGCAATFCSSAIQPIPRPPRKPSRPPSPSRSSRALVATNC